MTKLEELDTYVFIDVSNIRYACLRSCGFNIDFIKFYEYLKRKYPMLRDVRYYEGIAADDEKKKKHFEFLEKKIGYRVCYLDRKSYVEPAKFMEFTCNECGARNTVQVLPSNVKLKSNVDVYMTADMLELAATSMMRKRAAHIILVSCDGDFAEAICALLRINPNFRVTVLATPKTKKNNFLSVRLKTLCRELGIEKYTLASILNIRDKISQ